MCSIKSLILVADVYKSISLLRFQEEYRTLSLVSRDYHPMSVYSIEYVVDPPNLGFLVSDNEENLVTFMYHPESRESFGGQRLLRKADYHIGQRINSMFRVQCSFRDTFQNRRSYYGYENKQATFYCKYYFVKLCFCNKNLIYNFLFQLPLRVVSDSFFHFQRKHTDDFLCCKTCY